MTKVPPQRRKAAARLAIYRLEDQIGFLLRRAYQRASANLQKRINTHGLTPPQFATLARLLERGPLSQNLLGRLVFMEPANIRDVVQRLDKRGLVTTGRAAEDGRMILVCLTRKGKTLVERLIPADAECTEKTLASLDSAERKTLYELLGRLEQ